MAQQRRQQQQRGHRRGVGGGLVVVLLLALLSLCLSRADARASLARAAPASSEHGVAATALENAVAQEVAREHYTTSTAAPEELDDGAVVTERMAMEATTQDYRPPCANGRHSPPYP